MATDYKNIAEKHKEYYGTGTSHLRIYKRLYSDKTHFVYELIQNADDHESRCLELQLGENGLLVWNDGCLFSEEDVRNICSIGSSDKDLTQIGTFGIGFKAVYGYTDFPEIYSGDERFRIRDLTEPEGIYDMAPRITEQVDKGRTVFCLPFKDGLSQEEIGHLKNRLCGLEKRALLFLRNLRKVKWRDERDALTGSYSCYRHPHDKIHNALQVELMASMNGDNQPSETFLVFRKDVQPPQDLIHKLLQEAEDDKEQQRIQQSANKQQPVEVAFKLRDGRITAMDSCVLFAYLPTQKETHLRFLIQARYQTTPARDNIPTDNPWNRWLVQETADFLPEVLEQLKASGLLEPEFFDVLPLETDSVPTEFDPIAEALRTAMKNRPLVPTQDGGYAKAESVFYPDTEPLRQLIKSSWLHPDNSWLHPEIQDTKAFHRCFEVMRKAGVKKVGVSQMLDWLEKQSLDWFKGRPNEWLYCLYAYLNRQKSQLERTKKLPLVRLENGEHVCASDQAVFLPPNTDEEREEIRPFLDELPIVRSVLIKGEAGNDIEAFLKNMGASDFRPKDIIREWIHPKYLQAEKPSVAQNRLHVRYLFEVWESVCIIWKEKISKTPILRAYRGVQQEACDFVAPCNAYLPQAYGGNADLETYFSVCDDVWFVDDGYLEGNSKRKDWLQFLKDIGAMDRPRVSEKRLPVNDEELTRRSIMKKRSTRHTIEYHHIKDHEFDGLSEVLAEISTHRKANLSQALWCLLVKSLPSGQWSRDNFFQGTYCWFYHQCNHASFDARFYCQLKETVWLPDEQGKLRSPSECFAPTSENREVLGDSVAYLHPDFDTSKEPAQWLAEKLGVHLKANTGSVLNYLQTLSDTSVSVQDVELLYRFLAQQNDRPREKFKEESLIFTPNPEPRWWRTDEVFWEDESVVFGNDRGFLKAHYAETLKPFFTDLGVSERASPLDYVRDIQEVTSVEQAGDAEVRRRVKALYRRLWQSLQEGDSWLGDEKSRKEWEQTREGRCWLGKKGNEWGFFHWHELVWKDHDYRAQLFEGKVPFWAFDDNFLELARNLGVEGCSQAKVELHPYGNQEDDGDWSEKVRNLSACIHAFLKSPPLCNKKDEEVEPIQVLDRLSVRRVEKLKVTYRLKGIPVTDQGPRQSFLDKTDQEVTLWLGLTADKDECVDLIGDALQEYFGIRELREFAKDLLTTNRDIVFSRWKKRGLRTDLCVSSSETDSKEGEEKPPETLDEKLPAETISGDNNPVEDKSELENPTVRNVVEMSSGDGDPVRAESEPSTYHPQPGADGISSRGGHWDGISGGGGHGSHGGGGESEKHRKLKESLAENPSQLGEGLKLVDIEHRFKSDDQVDILLEDSSGNPVTVEVETHIRSGNYVGIWQAVKYKHLAAVEYRLPCKEVRSILAAPKIPDDVKMECRNLGIEPKMCC